MIDELLHLSPAALAERMASGDPLTPDQLAGRWYRGVSLGLWGWVEKLTWKTFAKTFHRDGDGLRGWNVRLHQDGLTAPPRPQTKSDIPIGFGHYIVRDGGGRADLELDYDVPRNGLDPLRLVRDPLVALTPQADLLLGRTLLSIGGQRIRTPSFFVLEPIGPIPDEVVDAARSGNPPNEHRLREQRPGR